MRFVKKIKLEVSFGDSRMPLLKSLRSLLEVTISTASKYLSGEIWINLNELHPETIYDLLNDIVQFSQEGSILLLLSDSCQLSLVFEGENREGFLKKTAKANSFSWVPPKVPSFNDQEQILTKLNALLEEIQRRIS